MTGDIEWSYVKALWLSDTLGAPADPVTFRLALIMKDGTTEDLQRDASAALLRQIALRISAERDIPLDDWTRAIPPGGTLSDSFTSYLRASLTADDEPCLPRGGVADGCFLAGNDAETFRETLAGIAFAAVEVMAGEGHDMAEAKACSDFCATNERDRFRALCDANGRERLVKL